MAARRLGRASGARDREDRQPPPVIGIAGASGVGKTRLLTRLIPALTSRGLRVAAVKHTRHAHLLDRPGKDTALFRLHGAVAAAITGPGGTAWFGPPVDGPAALVRGLPPVDLVLAEGWRAWPLPRIEVHRRSVSRGFVCAHDPLVFAVVGDRAPPRPLPLLGPDEIERIADLVCARAGLGPRRGLPGRPPVRSLRAGRSKRTLRSAQGRSAPGVPRRGFAPGRLTMAKTTSRRQGGRSTKSRSDAGRKGGRATLRARGPEFFSEIGRKGGKSRSRKAAAGRGRTASRSSAAKPRSKGGAARRGRGKGR